MRIFLFCILVSLQGFGQNALIPFEFERHPPAYYQSVISELNANFSEETGAFDFYLTAYKLQRASNPSDYFVAPNTERTLAKEYLLAFYTGSFSLALIDFLESEDKASSAEKLIDVETDLPEGAFYKYLAAKILKKENQARTFLLELDNSKLISPITKAFGMNAVYSAESNKTMITQGFQDMLAIDYGLMELEKQNIRVLNSFLESLSPNQTSTIKQELNENSDWTWISPTIDPWFLTMYSEGLWLEGIGFHWNQIDALKVIMAELKIEEVRNNFEGINEKPLTPADLGLIISYRAFAEVYQKLADTNDDRKQKSKAEKLTAYIHKYMNE